MTLETIIETWIDLGDSPKRLIPEGIGAGIYDIVSHHNVVDEVSPQLLYIGSTMNVSKRFSAHSIIRTIKFWNSYQDIKIYFTRTSNYTEVEKLLIEQLRPKLNVVWNTKANHQLLSIPSII